MDKITHEIHKYLNPTKITNDMVAEYNTTNVGKILQDFIPTYFGNKIESKYDRNQNKDKISLILLVPNYEVSIT